MIINTFVLVLRFNYERGFGADRSYFVAKLLSII